LQLCEDEDKNNRDILSITIWVCTISSKDSVFTQFWETFRLLNLEQSLTAAFGSTDMLSWTTQVVAFIVSGHVSVWWSGHVELRNSKSSEY